MNKLAWYISIAISLFGVLMIRYFFTLSPEEKNPTYAMAFMPMVFVIPFLLLSLFITVKMGSYYFAQKNAKRILCFALIAIFVCFVSVFMEYSQIESDLHALGGSFSEPSSKLYGLPIWNNYTTSWFCNEYIYFIVHIIAFSIGSFLRVEHAEEQ